MGYECLSPFDSFVNTVIVIPYVCKALEALSDLLLKKKKSFDRLVIKILLNGPLVW